MTSIFDLDQPDKNAPKETTIEETLLKFANDIESDTEISTNYLLSEDEFNNLNFENIELPFQTQNFTNNFSIPFNLQHSALGKSIKSVITEIDTDFLFTRCNDLLNLPSFMEKLQISKVNAAELSAPQVCPYITYYFCDENRIEQINQLKDEFYDQNFNYPVKISSKDFENRIENLQKPCNDIHFKKIINSTTRPHLGHCSFLNVCQKNECKYVHYALDEKLTDPKVIKFFIRNEATFQSLIENGNYSKEIIKKISDLIKDEKNFIDGRDSDFYLRDRDLDLIQFIDQVDNNRNDRLSVSNEIPWQHLPPQFIKADIKKLDLSALGQFNVILMDPPWDIHMHLPYGTMQDDEMADLKIPQLSSKTGPCLLFLWVTGRTREIAAKLMQSWGFADVSMITWVKTNQLGAVVRTGRTGHWLNHAKENCLVGFRGNLDTVDNFQTFDPGNESHVENVIQKALKNNILTNKILSMDDIIISNVRETSRKPDELYELIEQMTPTGRKIELFGRQHNTRKGWLTIGNQLSGNQLHDRKLIENFYRVYANGEVPT